MTERELMQRLRADAVRELERVKVLAGVLPFTFMNGWTSGPRPCTRRSASSIRRSRGQWTSARLAYRRRETCMRAPQSFEATSRSPLTNNDE
jgi:hypothetical protein